MWSPTVRNQAIQLRREGLSLNQIIDIVSVPKTTLYDWISKIRKPETLTKAGKVAVKHLPPHQPNGMKRKREFELLRILKKVQEDVFNYPRLFNQAYYRSLLAMLYWAEGSKAKGNTNRASLAFANTDPRLCLLFLTLLRASYPLDEKRLKVYLYLHYYHDQEETKDYWSNLLKIPLNQFAKIRLKRRAPSRFRANHRGICFIRYSSVDLQYQITSTALELNKQIINVLRP